MKKFTIYLAGDSTVQSYKTPVKPITGWGQMLHTYFKETEQKMNQDGCDWMGYGKKLSLIHISTSVGETVSQTWLSLRCCLAVVWYQATS